MKAAANIYWQIRAQSHCESEPGRAARFSRGTRDKAPGDGGLPLKPGKFRRAVTRFQHHWCTRHSHTGSTRPAVQGRANHEQFQSATGDYQRAVLFAGRPASHDRADRRGARSNGCRDRAHHQGERICAGRCRLRAYRPIDHFPRSPRIGPALSGSDQRLCN